MKRILTATAAAVVLTGMAASGFSAPGDPIFYEAFEANSWSWFTAHFDQSGAVANGDISQAGGVLVFNDATANGTDTLATTAEHTSTSTAELDIALTAGAGGGFFTVGFGASTAGGSRIDCDLYEDSGTYYIGVYDAEGGTYGASAVALSPQPVLDGSDAYKATATINGEIVTYELTSLDGLTTYATTSRDMTGIANTPEFGLIFLKNSALGVNVDNFSLTEDTTSKVLMSDDFEGASIDLANWFAEPNPDVNEGGSGGMRIFNFGSADAQTGDSRPDLQGDGTLTMRGGTLAGAGGEFYSRVPTRFGGSYGWFGDVDVLCVLNISGDGNGDAVFSLALDNRTNEGARAGVFVNATNPTAVRLGISEALGGALGYGGAGAITPTEIGTGVTLAGFDASADTAYLHIQRNGNAISAFISDSVGGSPITGTASATFTTANADGQIVLTAHRGLIEVDDIAVWEYSASQAWTLPAPSGVSDWTLLN